ncbi:MAG: hypothetical protein HQM13_07555 [SAR324 cluster bacterium]|nr:hypothetical protein [SAR324 cluster bacterium]
MRYLWLVFLTLFIGIGALFVYQNQAPVTVQFRIDWINMSFGLSRVPIFVPILLALVCGILVTVSYLFGYHALLRLRNNFQRSEIYRLKKLVLLERGKNKQLQLENQKKRPSFPPQNSEQLDTSVSPDNQIPPAEEQENSLIPQEDKKENG